MYYIHFERLQNMLDIYFEISLFHQNSDKRILSKFKNNILNMLIINHDENSNHQRFVKAISNAMKIDADSIKVVSYQVNQEYNASLQSNRKESMDAISMQHKSSPQDVNVVALSNILSIADIVDVKDTTIANVVYKQRSTSDDYSHSYSQQEGNNVETKTGQSY